MIEQGVQPRPFSSLKAATAVLCTLIVAGAGTYVALRFAPPERQPVPQMPQPYYGQQQALYGQPAAAPVYQAPPPAYALPPAPAPYVPPAAYAPAAPAPTPAPAPAPAAQAPTSVFRASTDNKYWVIPDPAVGRNVLDALMALPAIGGVTVPGDDPIIAFFDPRCPYCYSAHKALGARADVRWVPVPALGDVLNGAALIRAIMGSGDPTASLDQAMHNEEARRKGNPGAIRPLAPIQETQATKDQLAISFDAFVQIAKALQAAGAQGIGVPLFIVRSRSGQVGAFIGDVPDLAARLDGLKGS